MVPERIGPALGLRNLAIGQAGDERIKAVEREHLAASLVGKALQERTDEPIEQVLLTDVAVQ